MDFTEQEYGYRTCRADELQSGDMLADTKCQTVTEVRVSPRLWGKPTPDEVWQELTEDQRRKIIEDYRIVEVKTDKGVITVPACTQFEVQLGNDRVPVP